MKREAERSPGKNYRNSPQGGKSIKTPLLMSLLLVLVVAAVWIGLKRLELAKTGTPAPTDTMTTSETSTAPTGIRQVLTGVWGDSTFLVLRNDGTVVPVLPETATESAWQATETVAGWTDIKALAASAYLVLGLKEDGTAVAVPLQEDERNSAWLEEVSTWENLIEIEGSTRVVAGIRMDGTIAYAGEDTYAGLGSSLDSSPLFEKLDEWNGVQKLEIGFGGEGQYAACLHRDGTVSFTGAKGDWSLPYYGGITDRGWTDTPERVTDIACNGYILAARTEDGRVVANGSGAETVEAAFGAESDIAQIALSGDGFAALRGDGTVAVSDHYSGCGVTELKNGKRIQFAGETLALYLWDGRVKMFSKTGPVFPETETWGGIDQVYNLRLYNSERHEFTEEIIGVREDGTAVSTGSGFPELYALALRRSGLEASGAVIPEWTPAPTEGAKQTPIAFEEELPANPEPNRSRIVQVVAGESAQNSLTGAKRFSLGLREDGTVAFAGDLPESSQRDLASWRDVSRLEISGMTYIIGYRESGPISLTSTTNLEEYGFDGTARMNWTTENFDEWTDVVSVLIDFNFIAGLRKDGSVLVKTGGLNDRINFADFDRVAEWSDIASLYSYNGSTLIGLKKDGTVTATDNYWLNYYWNRGKAPDDESDWNHITRIESNYRGLFAIREDGSVLGAAEMDGTPWPSWQNQYLKETVIGSDSWFGLRNDGTVAVLGSSSSPNDTRILELQSWQNISELSMTGYSRYIPVGLCADGTVRVVTNNNGTPYGEWNVSGWNGVVRIFTGSEYILGLRQDGSVLATGGEFGTLEGIEEAGTWTDITDIACTDTFILGLKTDGTVVAVGDNQAGQCEITDWGSGGRS